jgi:hypothetical protein
MVTAALCVGMGFMTANAQAPAAAPAAGNKGTNESADKGKDTGAADAAKLGQAVALVAYARENESPVAMLTAVQMLRGLKMQDGKARVGAKKTEAAQAGAAADAKKGSTPAPSVDTAALLNEAKGWAKGNTQLVALIDQELAKPAATGTLGRTTGPARHVDRVLPGESDYYTVAFRGGEVARVQVVGDGDTDLDLYIYDENGNLITKDDDNTDFCVAAWTPRWTGNFRIRIRNIGRVYNQYTLLTN